VITFALSQSLTLSRTRVMVHAVTALPAAWRYGGRHDRVLMDIEH